MLAVNVGDLVLKEISYKDFRVGEIDVDDLFYGRILNFKPIPLTKGILNEDFEEYRNDCYRLYIAEGIYINIDFLNKEPFVTIHNKSYYCCPVCKYVHQFQHALEVVGINKNFVKFKL